MLLRVLLRQLLLVLALLLLLLLMLLLLLQRLQLLLSTHATTYYSHHTSSRRRLESHRLARRGAIGPSLGHLMKLSGRGEGEGGARGMADGNSSGGLGREWNQRDV